MAAAVAGADTIVALSSGGLPSGVAVVRLSGPQVRPLLVRWCGSVPAPRVLSLRSIGHSEVIDRGLVAFFPGPSSFTGEDCAEFQVHGSRAVVKALLRGLAAEPGVRLAEAGEFTRRAFENGQLDLTQAQGLADLIEAETEGQRRAALARADGGLSVRLHGWRERLLDLRAEVEAQLDFADEGDVGVLSADFWQLVDALRSDLAGACDEHKQGRIIREGFRIVLAGPPNAGKSSLLNALAKSEVAIVSDEPGTTRDLNTVPLDLGGQLALLIDSAGIRETTSVAEAKGIERTQAALSSADLVLWLIAPDVPSEPPALVAPVLTVATKADLGAVNADFAVSALTGSGLAQLQAELAGRCAAAAGAGRSVLVSHEQDLAALIAAETALHEAIALGEQLELVAEALRQATVALERLLGRIDAEQVLDQLFARFCIGK